MESTLAAAGVLGDPDGADLHAVNGDGGSLCGTYAGSDLTPSGGVLWHAVPPVRRCRDCQLLMTSYGMGHL